MLNKIIIEKGNAAQQTFAATRNVFELLKSEISNYINELGQQITPQYPHITLEFEDKGRLEMHLKVANDVLVFIMNTNIHCIDPSGALAKTSYIKEDNTRGFLGMICIYNFMLDSIRYNRVNDHGILLARVLVNKDKKFILEGKKQLGVKFTDLINNDSTSDNAKLIIELVLHQAMEIDPVLPTFDTMINSTVAEIQNRSYNGIENGKRFGFVMQSEKSDFR